MAEMITRHGVALEKLCRQYRVRTLEVFGSAAGDSFDPGHSDLDFLVEFLPLEPGQHFDCYFGLLQELRNLFHRDVDLVIPSAVRNPHFLTAIRSQRRLLYAA